jgi:hypothetical protein
MMSTMSSMSNASTMSKMSNARRRYLQRAHKEEAEQLAVEQAAADAHHEVEQKAQSQAEKRAFSQLAKLLWKVQKLKAAAGKALYDGICAAQHAAKEANGFAFMACLSAAAACAKEAADHARLYSVGRADWAVGAVVARDEAMKRVHVAVAESQLAARKAHASMLDCVQRSAIMHARWAARQAKAMSRWAGWWCWWASQHAAETAAATIARKAFDSAESADERAEMQVQIATETRELMRAHAALQAADVAANMANDAVQQVSKQVKTMQEIVDFVSVEWLHQQEVAARKRARALAEAQKHAYLAAKKAYYASLRTAKAATEAAEGFAKKARMAVFELEWRIKMDSGGAPFQIWVRTLGESTTFPIEVNSVVTVEMIKSRIELAIDQPIEKQRLVFVAKGARQKKDAKKAQLSLEESKQRAAREKRGSELANESSVEECGITAGETLILDYRNDTFAVNSQIEKKTAGMDESFGKQETGDPLDSIGAGFGADPLDSIGASW